MVAALVVAGLVAVLAIVLSAVWAFQRPDIVLALYAVVVPFGSTISLPGPPPFNNLSSLVGAAAIGAYAGHLMFSRRGLARAGTPAAWWVLLVAYACLTSLWSISPTTTAGAVAVMISLTLLFILVAITPVDAGALKVVEVGILVSGVVVSAYALYLASQGILAGAVDQRFVAAIGGSETGDIADPNVTAASLLLPFFIGVRPTSRLSGPLRLLYLGSAFLIFVAIFLTGSRGALVGMAFGFIVMVLASPNKRRAMIQFSIPAAGLGLSLLMAIALAPGYVLERFASDNSSSGRTHIWTIALRSCPEYCIQGSGWGTFPQVHSELLTNSPVVRGIAYGQSAHNVWLDAVVTGGVVGLGLLVIGVVSTWRQTAGLPDWMRPTPRAALVALLVSSSLISTLPFKYFWLVLIYLALLHSLGQQEDSQAVRRAPLSTTTLPSHRGSGTPALTPDSNVAQ